MFDEGVFWGLISITGVIAGLGIPYVLIYRKRTSELKDLTDFLKRMVFGQIDEKIAMLNRYVAEVPSWRDKDKEYVGFVTNRIVADITSVSRIKEDISDDQRIKINEQLIRLTNAMKTDSHDTAQIEAVSKLLG